MQKQNSALILEGGSLRGLFTAGVLDVLMENQIEFPYINGVSAGAMCALNFVSGQIKRTRNVNVNYIKDHKYIGIRNLLLHGGVFNFDYLFHVISSVYDPFDWDKFYSSTMRYEAVATNCITGEAEYFEKGICKEMEKAATASSSMPVLAKMVEIDEKKYLDGGIAMPVAYKRAIEEGYRKNIVVLTREHGFQKPEVSPRMLKIYVKLYGEYPYLLERLIHAPELYNKMQEEMDLLEKEGKIFIIRPEFPVLVKRIEKDKTKLEDLYEEGRRVMVKQFTKMQQYLEG